MSNPSNLISKQLALKKRTRKKQVPSTPDLDREIPVRKTHFRSWPDTFCIRLRKVRRRENTVGVNMVHGSSMMNIYTTGLIYSMFEFKELC